MKRGQIKNVQVPLQVILGETSASVAEVASMHTGTIIPLDTLAGEPINVVASGALIARGEVVVIDENYGIRLTEIVTQEEEV